MIYEKYAIFKKNQGCVAFGIESKERICCIVKNLETAEQLTKDFNNKKDGCVYEIGTIFIEN